MAARCLALAAALCALPAAASAQLTLANTWEGPYDLVSTGSSLRTTTNGNNTASCAVGTSTSATISGIPAGATVTAAYLYWAASGNSDATVTFNGATVSAARTVAEPYANGATTLTFHGSMADVTSQVAGNGTYTFSGLTVDAGGAYCSSAAVVAGFALYVVYRIPGTTVTPRRVQIRDGLQAVRSATSTFTLTGFVGAATPSVKLTALVWEGDPDISGGESLRFNGNSLTNGNNAFASSGAAGGASVHGLDLESFTTTVPAGATSATVDVITGTDLILLQTVTTSISVANAYGVDVTPNGVGTPLPRLPGNGYTQAFKIRGTSNVSATYDLILSATGTPFFIITQGYAGVGITATARADSFVVTLAAGDSTSLIATYGVAVGPNAINTGYVRARVRVAPTVFDDGWAEVERVSPQLTLAKSVSAPAALGPAVEITYNIQFANSGKFAATQVQVVDEVPAQVAFKLNSFTQTLPGGLTATVAYSSDAGATWTYVPVAGGCGMPAAYDGCVRRIRWTLSGPLPAGTAASTGTLHFVARVR
jgi:uncharacterized repeat protein (TIGR01451 family)